MGQVPGRVVIAHMTTQGEISASWGMQGGGTALSTIRVEIPANDGLTRVARHKPRIPDETHGPTQAPGAHEHFPPVDPGSYRSALRRLVWKQVVQGWG